MEKQEIEKYVYKELGQMSFVEIADWVVDLCKRNDELSTELKKSKAIRHCCSARSTCPASCSHGCGPGCGFRKA